MSKRYLHLVDGRPGQFYGDQVCFVRFIDFNKLPKTLYTLRKEQAKTIAYRKKNKFTTFDYSYMIVRVSE